jgi:hypothetical protein
MEHTDFPRKEIVTLVMNSICDWITSVIIFSFWKLILITIANFLTNHMFDRLFAYAGILVFFVLLFSLISKTFKALADLIKLISGFSSKTGRNKITTLPYRYRLIKLTKIMFSTKTQKEVFLTAMAEWDEEIYEVLKENKDANLFMINVRNTYGFIMAMWQKSPLGDLIEYVRKIAS